MNPSFVTSHASSLHYNLLINLARLTVTYFPSVEPTFEFAQHLRMSLLELLELYK